MAAIVYKPNRCVLLAYLLEFENCDEYRRSWDSPSSVFRPYMSLFTCLQAVLHWPNGIYCLRLGSGISASRNSILFTLTPYSFHIHYHRTIHRMDLNSVPCKHDATEIPLVRTIKLISLPLSSHPGHVHATSGSESVSISQSEPAHSGSPSEGPGEMLFVLVSHGDRLAVAATQLKAWSKL